MRKTRPIRRGDYFLLPYTGPAKDRLIRVTKRFGGGASWDTWWAYYPCGPRFRSFYNLTPRNRISEYMAQRIIAASRK